MQGPLSGQREVCGEIAFDPEPISKVSLRAWDASGSPNAFTSFCRFPIPVVPSSLTTGYPLSLQSVAIRSRV